MYRNDGLKVRQEGPTAALCIDGDVGVLEYQHPFPTAGYNVNFSVQGQDCFCHMPSAFSTCLKLHLITYQSPQYKCTGNTADAPAVVPYSVAHNL